MSTTWEEVRTEAEEVIALHQDEQFLGGQRLAEMVLEFQGLAEMVLGPESIYIPVTDDEATDLIGEGVHVGLRKGSEAPSSGDLWRAIALSTDTAWSDAVRYCVNGLDTMGYKICKADES